MIDLAAAERVATYLEAGKAPTFVSRLNKTLPAGWFEQAVADLPTLFAADLRGDLRIIPGQVSK